MEKPDCIQPLGMSRLRRHAGTLLLCEVAFMCLAMTVCAEVIPVLANGGFERDTWEWRSLWGHQGHRVVTNTSFAGASCMYFSRMGAIRTLRYRYRGGPVSVSGWYRLRAVKTGERPYYRFWVLINLFDKEGARIKHIDITQAEGTCDWTHFVRKLDSLPDSVGYIEVSVALQNCTGEAWVDEIQLEADASLDWPSWRYPEQPYYNGTVLPEPRNSTYGAEIPISQNAGRTATTRLDVYVGATPCRGAQFGADQIRFRLLKSLRVLRQNVEPRSPKKPAVSVSVHLGKLGDRHIREAAERIGIDLPSGLGPQEHLVRTVADDTAVDVIAVGGDDKGVAYAAASIVQMIGVRDRQVILRAFDLRDRPDMMRRASSDYMPLDPGYLSRLVLYKMSVYAMQHRSWWRQVGPDGMASPVSGKSYEERLEAMRDFVRQTGVIDLMMLVHIYVTGGRPAGEVGPPFNIADESHISDLITRLRWLYDHDVTMQMVCVDDYTDRRNGRYVCKTDEETDRFGSVGRAHGFLMRRLWEALSPHCPDLKLCIVPAPYSLQHLGGPVSRESGARYLAEMAEEMPDEVAVVWTGPRIVSRSISAADWEAYGRLVPEQPLLIWDNGQAGSPVPGYTVELFENIDGASAWSLMYQNSHFVGWPSYLPAALCANDAMWDLGAYDPERVHRVACAKGFGAVDYADVQAVNNGYHDGRRLLEHPDPDLAALRKLTEGLYASLDRLEAQGFPGSVPRRHLSGASVTPDVVRRFEWIPTAAVPRSDQTPKLDGRLDDSAWEKAAVLSAFKPVDATPDDPGGEYDIYATTCRITYTRDALWIACECRHGQTRLHPHENVGKPDGNIFFNSDTIEVFLGPRPAVKEYSHLAVDHTNTRFDERRPKPGSAWNGKWDCAVMKQEDRWTLEMQIPFSDLGESTPAPGDLWKANICRAFGQQNQLSCWAPTYGNFHNWTFFGRLRFE